MVDRICASVLVLLAALLGANAPALAAQADPGPTWPLAAFLAERLPEGANTQLTSDAATAYPVVAQKLRPGVLTQAKRLPARQLRWLEQPIALIGDDPQSRAWLTQHGDQLLRLKAQVLVVHVASSQRMRTLRQLRSDVPMAAGEAAALEPALIAAGARVYPLLIQSDGTVRQALDSAGGRAP